MDNAKREGRNKNKISDDGAEAVLFSDLNKIEVVRIE